MRKIFFTVLSLLFIASNLMAQNVSAILGGNTTSDFFDIKDNSGNVIFRVDGTGQVGVGTTTFYNTLNINGGLNLGLYSAIEIDGSTVFVLPGTNTFVGFSSGTSIDGGVSNTCLGNAAGKLLDDGNYNTFLGKGAGENTVDAPYNTYVGYLSGNHSSAGEYNTYVGALSGRDNISGNKNTCIGFDAGLFNQSGSSNVLLGYYAGGLGTSLAKNVIIGYSAGKNNNGSNNVFIGYNAGFNETGSNKLYIDNSNTANPLIYGDFDTNELTINGDLTVTGTITELSDRRYKTEIEPIKNVLKKLEGINAVYYKWNKKDYPDMVVGDEREIGVIAQDVEKVFPELVKTDSEGMKSVNYAKLSAILLQATKDQQNEINQLKSEIKLLKTKQAEAIYELTKAVSEIKRNDVKVSSYMK